MAELNTSIPHFYAKMRMEKGNENTYYYTLENEKKSTKTNN